MKLSENQLYKFINDVVLAHIRSLIEFKGTFTRMILNPSSENELRPLALI